MKKSVVMEFRVNINWAAFKCTFDYARRYFEKQGDTLIYSSAIKLGKELLELNKSLANEFENYIGYSVTKELDVAAFGFAIFYRYSKHQEEAIAM